MLKLKGYYFITDASLSLQGNRHDVEEARLAGACAIQYRNKNGSFEEQLSEAFELRKRSQGTPFIVNDDVEIALRTDADGVHVGQDDSSCLKARTVLGAEKIVGVTVHNLEEALRAEQDGADYLGVSPVFSTTTKKDAGNPGGLELVSGIRKRVKLPLVAIGGINLSNAAQVIQAGADSICAISAVVASPDVRKAILNFIQLFEK